jgi:hypothetical protein
MACKHNRIIKQLIKVTLLPMANSKLISDQYKEVYVCSHCGQTMEVKPL